ncbi:hypothetical protein Rt10032_c09g4039 [Rhodotorula toruloides]|uniref:Uncharacterized protein n=1 Tax=Rhodotorula toruloides TaxID=5286 RepID=A0A511KI20_RHOTO|nr:hypothetical protein Rt10032_c09g4039 [Rhodotorula toruloides]
MTPSQVDSPSTTFAPSSSSSIPTARASSVASTYSAPQSVSSSTSVDQSKLKALGISTFLGNLTGGIASWYHTDSSTDSTNGKCLLSTLTSLADKSTLQAVRDNDSVPGFAPSLKTMLSSFAGDAPAAKKAFCGLKATVHSPKTGKQVSMIIADAFDDNWNLLLSALFAAGPSIDSHSQFSELFGSTTNNKDDVVKDVWWMLTGGRDEKGAGVG